MLIYDSFTQMCASIYSFATFSLLKEKEPCKLNVAKESNFENRLYVESLFRVAGKSVESLY